MDKIKELYALYLSKGLITDAVSFEDFSSASDDQKTQLYSLGKDNILFDTTDLGTFTSAWGEPKKVLDPANAETTVGSIQDTVSKLENGFSEYRKKDVKSDLTYPEQAQDAITAPTSGDKYFKDLEASKSFYESEEGKAYTKQKSDYRESVKIKLRKRDAYKSAGDIADSVNELHFSLHGNKRPSLEIRDQIIQEEVLKAEQREEQSLKDLKLQETEKYIANGDYKPMFEVFRKQAESTFTPEEKNLSDLNKNLDAVNIKIKKTVDIEEKRILKNKRSDLISQIKSSPLLEDRTFLFDPITSDPVGTFEADEKLGEVLNKTEEYNKLKQEYAKSGREKLERKAFTHGLEKTRLNKIKNSTIDIDTNKFELGNALTALGYERDVKSVGVFKDVKYSDLMTLRNNPLLIKAVQESLTPADGTQGYIVPDMKNELDTIAEDSIRLALEAAALKETYYLNLDPSSDDAGFIDGTGSFLKESAKSIGKIVGLDKTIGEMLPSTRMEELDEINNLFTSGDIPISEENKEAFNRGFGMQFAEGMGGFTGDLIQFALLNKAAGAAGITARIAQISNSNKLRGTALKLLQEEFNFQVVTRGEAPTGEGIFFGLGSMGATKLIPKIKNSKFARFNSPIEKLVAPGIGMAAGSEAAAFAHAVVDDFANNKDIKTAIKEQYGDLDETGMRVILNIAMGSALGSRSIKVKKDFSSIATRRQLLKNTEKEIQTLKPGSKEFNKKLALIGELKRDISFADEAFNKLDIGSQKSQRDEALKIIQSKATASEKAAAQETVDLYETNRVLAENKIRKSFENFMRSGITDKAKLVITDDPTLLKAGNKGQFEKSTNTITININKYKPGVFEHETGHLFMKAAFENNTEVAKTFKDKISEILNEKLKGESFSVGESKDLSFEEAIKEAYNNIKKDIPEEYIMNAVEFLSNPEYKDLLTKKGLLNELKQETLNTANKIGFDYTNKENFKTGADLLEFLFSINKTIEGGSGKAIKKKFDAFKNLVIDGKKLLDLKTGKEAVDPSKAEDIMASAEIDPESKKDIFSKAEKAYNEYKESPSDAGLMVGMEFQPIVEKKVRAYLTAKGLQIPEYVIEDIVADVSFGTGKGSSGIPTRVMTYDKVQKLIKYIKESNPSEAEIETKAKELNVRSDSTKRAIEFAKGNKAEATMTSYVFGQINNSILASFQKPEYRDMFKTVSYDADPTKTQNIADTGGGYVDSSSPELYSRVTRKKAEITMGMSPEYAKRAEEVGESILMTTPLKDLDARIVGTIKTNEGKVLRVAMLESNKARIYLPDGTVEVIKARTPKVVEQKYGAPEKSFKKSPTTKSLMIEEAKAYLIPEMEKEAGGLVDNYEATEKYRGFIDKTFSLYKNYLSQSAINKRFADFKEVVIDPVTGKQAREKTAQGKNIFTKKSLKLEEWQRYFIGDGTMRIDGRRRSLLEALATEQGFDKVMEVLSKESMREQIESKQEDLNVGLVENYVAMLAKSLDRGNPDVMASKVITAVADSIGKPIEYVKNELLKILDREKFNYSDFPKALKEKTYSDHNNLFDEFYNAFNEDYKAKINKAITQKPLLSSKITSYLQDVLKTSYNVDKFRDLEQFNKSRYEEYKSNVSEVSSYLLPPLRFMNFSTGKSKVTPGTMLSRFFGFDGFKSRVIDPNIVKNFSRKEFLEKLGPNGEKIGSKYEEFKKSLPENRQKELEKLYTALNSENLSSMSTHLNRFKETYKEIINKKGVTEKDIEKVIKPSPEYTAEQELRTKFFLHFLDVIDFEGKKRLEMSEAEYDNYVKNFIAPFFIEQSKEGFRNFSKKEWWSTVPAKNSNRVTDQHLKPKVVAASEFIDLFVKRKENPEGSISRKEVEKIMLKYESSFAAKEHQDRADIKVGATSSDWVVKIGSEQLLQRGQGYSLEFLKKTKSILTDKTLYDRYLEESFNPIIEGLKQDAMTKAHNNKIIKDSSTDILASKEIELSNGLAEMIERKKGISAKVPLSAAQASNIGKNKGKFDFYLPPNAEDFAGLMYKVYGKGKQGDADMAFIKEHLLDPYNAGEQAISTYKQNLAQDYKSIEKQLGEIEGSVSKETKQELEKLNFNSDQAVRVALWNQAGFEIPGIKNIEAAKLRSIVIKDKRLKAYADGIKAIVKGNLFEPSEQWFSSNIRYDLFTHATEGVRPIFLEQWNENAKAMFTKDNMNRLEAAYGKDYVNNLQGILDRMKSGKSRGANVGKEVNAALDYLNGSVGVIMWMNTRSAMLQTISAVNYINWGDNNPINIAKTLAKPKEFAKTFKEIMNSDFLKQRRSGLEINIEEAEIAKAVEKSKGKANALFNYLIKAGFKPTQIADSFAIAIGGTPLLINRTKTYQKKGLSLAKAKEKAFNDLREISEENQQSSRQDRVSNIQTGILGRLVFAFNNTPMQMTRLQKKSALDLINKRGDWKTNISKLAYYSTIQSVIFYALQQGTALTLFGKDDEDLTPQQKENLEKYKEKKTVSLANSVVDGFLSGSGMPGKILVTGKNTLNKYLEEEAKGYRADYGNVINEALSISPPLSSKTKKAYSAFKTYKYGSSKKGKAKMEEYNKFSPLHPYNVARAKIFSAATNIPVDRLLKKIENLNEAAFNESIEPQIRTALALGWDKWSLGFYDGLYDSDTSKKSEPSSKKVNNLVRKTLLKQKSTKLKNRSFVYQDSVRFANYRKKNKK